MFLLNNIWGKNTPFVKILVIRGIGFRAQLLLNDALKIDQNILNNEVFINYTKEFQYKKYLIIRAGHSVELVQPIPQNIIIKIIKKIEKLLFVAKISNLSQILQKSYIFIDLLALTLGAEYAKNMLKF